MCQSGQGAMEYEFHIWELVLMSGVKFHRLGQLRLRPVTWEWLRSTDMQEVEEII
jgi:hypothetical protein